MTTENAMIDAALLRAVTGCTQDAADRFAPYLDAACTHYGITTPQRLAAFLAQVGHESGSLRYVREVADGSAYEGRRDLGNVYPGDGPLYRGRGLIQITGRSNYRETTSRMGPLGAPDFEASPAGLESDKWACWSACDWWSAHGCNELADAGRFVALGRLINRGSATASLPANGEDDRIARWERARLATTPAPAPTTQPVDPIPAGEAPGWPPPETTVAPILAGIGKAIFTTALPEIVDAIPRLGSLFARSENAQRNVKALEVVADTIGKAVGAGNAQEAVEALRDPVKLTAARQAVDERWTSILDAVSISPEALRDARAFATQHEAAKDVRTVFGGLTFMEFLSLYLVTICFGGGVVALLWGKLNDQLVGAVVMLMLIGGFVGVKDFWFGSSHGSKAKDGGGSV